MEDAFEVVRRGYDSIAVAYRDWSSGRGVRHTWTERLLERLQPNSLVVELGCGSGEPATRRIAEHHRVIGVDASIVQLRLAQEAAPSALLVQADMTQLAIRAEGVDAVASFYASGHIPSDRHTPLFASIAGWLRPGGVLLTSTPVGAGDNVDGDWLGAPMFFGGIGEASTKQAVAAAGLRLDVFETIDEDEGDGNIVQFNWLIATKPGKR